MQAAEARVEGSSWLVPVGTIAAAALLVVGVTVLQGIWTERWYERDPETLRVEARILEGTFPERFGDWELTETLESDPKELERAGAVGHVARLYRSSRTKALVSVFVVCATPEDASGHTPDRCYPGAGFEIAETEHRHTVPMKDGRKAETFTGTFSKKGTTLRVFWTYSMGGQWVAPQIARIELAEADAVYKLYAIIDETRLKGSQGTIECDDFLAALLPVWDERVAEARANPAAVQPASPEGGAARSEG